MGEGQAGEIESFEQTEAGVRKASCASCPKRTRAASRRASALSARDEAERAEGRDGQRDRTRRTGDARREHISGLCNITRL